MNIPKSTKARVSVATVAMVFVLPLAGFFFFDWFPQPCEVLASAEHQSGVAKAVKALFPSAQACGGGGGGSGGGGGDNKSPVATAAARHWAPTDEPVRLWGTGSDPDGSIAKYEWDFDGNGTYDFVSPPNTYNNSFIDRTYTTVRTNIARFQVTDDKGATASDTTVVDIHTACPTSGPGSGVDCWDVVWDGERWPTTLAANGIPYVVDINTIPAGLNQNDAINAIVNAFNTWDSRSSGLRFIPDPAWVVGGVSGRCQGCGQLANNSTHVVFWGNAAGLIESESTDSSTRVRRDAALQANIAATRCYKSGEFNDAPNYDPAFPLNPYLKVNDCDIVLSNALTWSTSGAAGAYDLEGNVLHELGHWLVLGDLYQLRTAQLIMYGLAGTGPLPHSLRAGDVFGLQYLYGP